MTSPASRTAPVTVIIPCRDEAQSLPGVLDALPDGYRALVVDNASSDETAGVARAHGADVITEPVPGYGSAVHAGIAAAPTELICVVDGDGSLDPAELPALVRTVLDGADLAVGRRRPAHRGVWPLHARLGTALVAARLRHRHGLAVHDIAPARAARRSAVLGLGIVDRRSGYPVELLVRAARARWVVVECDVSYGARSGGRSKVSGSVRGSYRAARDFLAASR